MAGRLDNYLSFNEVSLSLRAQRQQLLASNIANADTPNYRARDIEFSSVLKNALLHNGESTAGLARTDAAHLSGKVDGIGGAPVLYRTVQQGSIDGNTVDMDVERAQFADNAIRYEAGLTMISAQIKKMLSVIQG